MTESRIFKRVVLCFYVAALVTVVYLFVGEIIETIRYFGNEPRWLTASRGIPSLAALLVTAAFVVVLIMRGFRVIAFPLFIASCFMVAISTEDAVHGFMKDWAPATHTEAIEMNFISFGIVVVALTLTGLAVWASIPRKKLSN